MLWALVPAKLGSTVKTRLGAALTPDERLDLAHAMLADVLTALGGVASLGGIAVVTRDPSVAILAERHGATALHESHGRGLNEAVRDGLVGCRARGASGVLVAMGDLPALTAAEVEIAIARLPDRGVLLVPSFDGTGTNLLAMRPADLQLPTHFGPDSLARHRAAAALLDLEPVTCPLRGAALDVDTVDDLGRLIRSECAGPATRRVLATLGDPATSPRGA
jgi:2-phospho-L-lactate guanylyltransferase